MANLNASQLKFANFFDLILALNKNKHIPCGYDKLEDITPFDLSNLFSSTTKKVE